MNNFLLLGESVIEKHYVNHITYFVKIIIFEWKRNYVDYIYKRTTNSKDS